MINGLFSDLAAVSVEQCEIRYDEMKRKSYANEKIFTAQFITADCAKVQPQPLDQFFTALRGRVVISTVCCSSSTLTILFS